MNDLTIIPVPLTGSLHIPPSKSACHRAMICAGLAKGASHLNNIYFSDDITATARALTSLGVKITRNTTKDITITGTVPIANSGQTIDCGQSGSTLRFLLPLALTNGPITFTGHGKLIERPLDSYYTIFAAQQIDYHNTAGKLPLTVNGTLQPGKFQLAGDISSQFLSGLLFALPRLNRESQIELTTPLESRSYVDMTINTLQDFGVMIHNNDYHTFYIPANQQYICRDYTIESDYSQAAFWLAAGLLGKSIECQGLDCTSLQGDKAIITILRKMGGKIISTDTGYRAEPSPIHGTVIDAAQCPDLVPVLAVLGALCTGTTKIVNARRLRFKESDRLHAISTELNKLGAAITEGDDFLNIDGRPTLHGGVAVNTWDDHRIAMALGIASLKCLKPLTIKDSSCVQKSYPTFWQDFCTLGGRLQPHDALPAYDM